MYKTERLILICREHRKSSSFLLMLEVRPSNDCHLWGPRGALTQPANQQLLPRVRGDERRPPERVGRVHHRTSSRGSMSSCSSLKALPWRPTCTALFFTTLLRFFSCLQHVLHFWCLQEGTRASAGTLLPYSLLTAWGTRMESTMQRCHFRLK